MSKSPKRIREGMPPGISYLESKDSYGRKDKIFYVRYKRPDGKWSDAKHGRKSKGKTITTAKQFRIELLAGNADAPQEEKAAKKAASINHLAVVFDRFSAEKGRNRKIRKEQADHKSRLGRYNNYLVPYFGEGKDLSTIAKQDFERFNDDLEKRDISPQTVKHILRLLKQLCKMTGNLIDAPMPTVKNHTDEDLTGEQVAQLKEVLTSHPNRILADMLSLIMCTGIRRGEALRLQREHVDFRRKTIKLVDRKSSGKDMDTSIPMNTAAEAILRRRIKENLKLPGQNVYIFPGVNGGKRFDAKRARSIMTAAGIPENFRPCHGLRHWYACELADKGVEPYVLMKLLGHNNLETTMRYYQAREKSLKEAAAIISQVMEA